MDNSIDSVANYSANSIANYNASSMSDYSTSKKLFGKEAGIILRGIDGSNGEFLAEDAHKEGLRLHKIFNLFDESSELSLLNRKRKIRASKELLTVIKAALAFSELTKGEYDISLGKFFQSRKKGDVDPKLNCSYKDIQINGNLITLKHPDVLVDLGSVAKGYIADKMVSRLESEGVLSGLIDARGDVRSFGENNQPIGIQHPRNRQEIIKSINIKNCAVATSGDYNQYYKDYDNCHIINSKELISVTVVAPSLMMADLWATVLFVSNSDTREKLLSDYKSIMALTIDKDLNLSFYNGFENLIIGFENLMLERCEECKFEK